MAWREALMVGWYITRFNITWYCILLWFKQTLEFKKKPQTSRMSYGPGEPVEELGVCRIRWTREVQPQSPPPPPPPPHPHPTPHTPHPTHTHTHPTPPTHPLPTPTPPPPPTPIPTPSFFLFWGIPPLKIQIFLPPHHRPHPPPPIWPPPPPIFRGHINPKRLSYKFWYWPKTAITFGDECMPVDCMPSHDWCSYNISIPASIAVEDVCDKIAKKSKQACFVRIVFFPPVPSIHWFHEIYISFADVFNTNNRKMVQRKLHHRFWWPVTYHKRCLSIISICMVNQ